MAQISRAVLLSSVLLALSGCSTSGGPSETATLEITGVADVEGIVTDSLGARLDSVRVIVGSAADSVLLRASAATTNADGSFSIRVERLLLRGSADSVLVTFAARSLRSRHQLPDGSTAAVTRQLWIPLAVPPSAARRVIVNVALNVER